MAEIIAIEEIQERMEPVAKRAARNKALAAHNARKEVSARKNGAAACSNARKEYVRTYSTSSSADVWYGSRLYHHPTLKIKNKTPVQKVIKVICWRCTTVHGVIYEKSGYSK